MDTYNYQSYEYQNSGFTKKIKKSYDFNNKDFTFFIFNIIATYLFLRVGVIGSFNIGFSITYVVMHLGYFIYSYKRVATHKILYFFTLVINVVLSASFFLHDNPLIKFVTVIALTFLSAFTLIGISSQHICTDGTFFKIFDVFYITCVEPFANIIKFIRSFVVALKGKNNKMLMVLLGVIVSVPFLFLVIPLLSSADVAFQSIIKRVFSDVAAMLVSLVLTVILLPVTSSYGFGLSKGITTEKNKSLNLKNGKVPPVFLNTFLCVIGLIYVVFLVSQLAYITDAFSFLLPEDFTASEFARSGFFQMSAITALNLIITFLVSVIEKPKESGRLPISTKLILTFFTIFSLFLTVNSFIRMSMYIDMYGLTQLRVLTSVFMIMLCVIFVIVLIRIFFEKFRYINFILITCALTCVVVSVTNIDTHISKYNYLKYTQGEIGVDFEHYVSLGSAAIPELVKLSRSDDYLTSRLALNAITDIAEAEFNYNSEDGFTYDKNYLEYNIVQNKAGKTLEKFFKKHKSVEYLDQDFADYKEKVAEYGATGFMPDFNKLDKSFSELSVSFDDDYYEENDDNNTIELVITYDNAVDYKNAFNKLSLKDRTKSTVEYDGYTFVLIDSDKIDMPKEFGIIAYSPDEMTIVYLWYQNDKTTYEDISDLEQFCKDNFELIFVY